MFCRDIKGLLIGADDRVVYKAGDTLLPLVGIFRRNNRLGYAPAKIFLFRAKPLYFVNLSVFRLYGFG
jgi:hypothetical protein